MVCSMGECQCKAGWVGEKGAFYASVLSSAVFTLPYGSYNAITNH